MFNTTFFLAKSNFKIEAKKIINKVEICHGISLKTLSKPNSFLFVKRWLVYN